MFKDSNNDAGAIHIYILLKYKLYGLILLCTVSMSFASVSVIKLIS